ncbi:MAG: ArsR/SmtB family transcription factor [Mycobacteriales bacterium]
MAGWTDPRHEVLSPAIALARELADPIRLTALQLLAAEGPHTMSQLAQALGVSAPRLGNHLARLRDQGLVTVEHNGRHAVYRVAAPGLGDVLAALSRYANAELDLRPDRPPPSPADVAHTCYDHAAGRLGIAVFGTLVARGALVPPDGRDDQLTLGPDRAALTELGVDVDALDTGRRKLATACLDKIYRLPHLGGALGKAVLDTFLDRKLVARQEGTRVLTVTPKGKAALPVLLRDFSTERLPEGA